MLSKTNLSSLAILLTLALLQAGCSLSVSSDSFSASSESVSTILTSPSTSSSGGDDEEEQEKVEQTTTLFEEDISALTVLYIKGEKSEDEFMRHIAKIAGNHGINDWEQEDSTFQAMGLGLKRAGIGEKAIQTSPYFENLTKSQYNLVIEGYRK